MKKALILIITFLWSLFFSVLFAQDLPSEPSANSSQIDELFSDTQDIINSDESSVTSIDHTTVFTEKPKLQFSGSISATVGVSIGYTQWPDPNNLLAYYDGAAGGTATTTLVMQAQPSSILAVYGNVASSVDTSETLSWSQFTIGSLYFDYYGISNVSIRAGQFSTTWGHGRIFSLSNLMSSSGDDLTLRVSFPLVFQGLSMFVLAHKKYFSSSTDIPAVSEYAYAANLDHVIGPVRITEGFRYQKQEGFRNILSVQGTLLGIDIFSDILLSFNENDFKNPIKTWGYVGGAFKEFSQTRLYGEYQYTSETVGGMDHTIALVFLQRKLFGQTLDAGFKWEHTFFDHSGQFVPGLTWACLPNGTLQFAFPITYGPDGARYVTNNEDPSKRRIMLAVLLKIEGSF
ncbi:hypothetical protein [Gracilinema caldarium]|uniref:hypothetical protein n=1 Tax=Gracilinema caldarium TaxID=215591 RepID=UPI0026F09FFF|nr:hypothetical protein [Gracilinema caldarium]